MRRLLVLATALIAASTSGALADPVGSIAQMELNGRLARGALDTRDCESLRRSQDLRARLRPSERRELIARCERLRGEIRIAGVVDGTRTAAPPTD